MIMALRLACLFHRSRSSVELPAIEAAFRDRAFEIHLPPDWLARYPLTAAALRSEIREWHAIGFDLHIPALDDLEGSFDPAVD
jgi:exopolyphosphatase/guanosine-5'-triphosphate,3'-diphosphate pyrophosphatase